MDCSLEQAGGPVQILVLGGTVECDVPERPVDCANRDEPPGQDHRRCYATNRPQIDIRLPDPEVSENESTVSGCSDAAITGDGADRILGDCRIPERPLDTQVEGTEETRAGKLAGHRAGKRQGIQVRAYGIEIELGQPEIHVANSESSPLVGDGHQLAIDLSQQSSKMQITNVIRGTSTRFGAGGEDAAPGHVGELGRYPAEIGEI